MRYAVLGGDARIMRLCHLLAADGQMLRCYGLEKAPGGAALEQVDSPGEAVAEADCVILPLPARDASGGLFLPLSERQLTMEALFAALRPGQLVCAGRVDAGMEALAAARGLTLVDYLRREELAVMNALATAEGAVAILLRDMDITLWDARVLVLGYGRIGKLLAHRLRGMGARVSVSARKWGDLAQIRAMGYTALDTRRLEGRLGEFDAIVNTVPAPVLGRARLAECKTGALCLDLASRPGGVDFAAAGELGLHTVWALHLPGEVAPASVGAMIRDTIYHIVKEREDGKG